VLSVSCAAASGAVKRFLQASPESTSFYPEIGCRPASVGGGSHIIMSPSGQTFGAVLIPVEGAGS
jgi:hypothetical protein